MTTILPLPCAFALSWQLKQAGIRHKLERVSSVMWEVVQLEQAQCQ